MLVHLEHELYRQKKLNQHGHLLTLGSQCDDPICPERTTLLVAMVTNPVLVPLSIDTAHSKNQLYDENWPHILKDGMS